jgi:hypothetical protein
MNIISLGAGVQSTALALMAAAGEIEPMPDCAIFADTQWEPKSVYAHLDWLCARGRLPFPVYRVTAGDLRQAVLDRTNTTGGRFAAVPWFMRMPDGRKAMGRRQCTKEYKLRPVQRKVVELLGGRPKGGATVWIGISMDEAIRMKPSLVQYIVNRWPLIEKQISREDCLRWLKAHRYPEPAKSACIGCPFHNDAYWHALRETSPDEWQDAVSVDQMIRHQPGFHGEQYMHRSLKPLHQIVLNPVKSLDWFQHESENWFLNECEGMCGV